MAAALVLQRQRQASSLFGRSLLTCIRSRLYSDAGVQVKEEAAEADEEEQGGKHGRRLRRRRVRSDAGAQAREEAAEAEAKEEEQTEAGGKHRKREAKSEAKDPESDNKSEAAARAKSLESEGAWKWELRKRVWDKFQMERRRYPEFSGAPMAVSKLETLPEFRDARVVHINPDTTQRPARVMALKNQKQLIVHNLPHTFMALLDPLELNPDQLKQASTQEGWRIGKALGLDSEIKIDLFMIGSVAVNPKTGMRLGKGQGHSDILYALLRRMKAIDESTPVVTMVNDSQLLYEINSDERLPYDVPVDIICTPTQVIKTSNRSIVRPTEIFWDKIIPQRYSQIRVLRELKEMIERRTGETIKLAPKNDPKRIRRSIRDGPAVFMNGFNPGTTEAEVEQHLQKLGVPTEKLQVYRTWQRMIVARLHADAEALNSIAKRIDNSTLKGYKIRARLDVGCEE